MIERGWRGGDDKINCGERIKAISKSIHIIYKKELLGNLMNFLLIQKYDLY